MTHTNPSLAIITTSRNTLAQHLRALTPNVAIITIAGIGTAERQPRLPSNILRLRITANDIEYAQQSYARDARLFDERDARKILTFVKNLPSSIPTLVIQCRGGASRSVAVASALRWILRSEPPPTDLTNRHIYDTILTVEKNMVPKPTFGKTLI